MSLLDQTDRAIAAAPHLQGDLFLGAVEALRMLARKADAWDVIVQWAVEDLDGQDGRRRPAVPTNDNVTLAAYARLSEQLGLTPTGRKTLTGVGAASRGDAAPADEPGTEDPTEDPKGGARRGKLSLIGDAPGRAGRPA